MARVPYLSCPQAAQRLGVSKGTIYNLLGRGHLTRHWVTSAQWGVTVRSVEQYEAKLAARNQQEEDRPVVKTRRELVCGL